MEPLLVPKTASLRTFAVYWTGSNVLVSPNLVVHYVLKYLYYNACELTTAVAKLLVCNQTSVKVHLAKPGGPELSRILHTGDEQAYAARFGASEYAWSQVDQHDPTTAVKVYVTQHSQVDMACYDLRSAFSGEVSSNFALMDATLRANWRVALYAVSLNSCCIINVAEKLLSNRQFLLAAVNANSGVLFKLRDKSLPKDKQAVFAEALRLLNPELGTLTTTV